MIKKARVALRLEQWLRDWLLAEARKSNISTSQVIVDILKAKATKDLD